MSKLTAEIKNAGLHDCNSNCYAISEKEARQAIELVKQACIEVVNSVELVDSHLCKRSGIAVSRDAIKAIEGVE